MTLNKVGREIPKPFEPYKGPFTRPPVYPKGYKPKMLRFKQPGMEKILPSIKDAISKTGLSSGMTVSFHHHLRNGDAVLNMVMEQIAAAGLKDMTVISSSLTTAHDPLLEHMQSGVVTKIHSSGLRSAIGNYVSKGHFEEPVIIRSHGGRARCIECGDVHIDVAFLASPTCDTYGNVNGCMGPSACGSLGYAIIDALYADQVVAVTDNLIPYPNPRISIGQKDVDFIVEVDSIGDPTKIASGSTRITTNPKDLIIAQVTADVIEQSGFMKNGMSFQTGTGGSSLAVAKYLRDKMIAQDIKGSFASGGITGYLASMAKEGLFETLFDVQTFDLGGVASLRENPLLHREMCASTYANPHNSGCVVNNLDVMILSALEIDTNFNVNVITGSNGVPRGASGGHSDTAAGSKLGIVVCPLFRGRNPTVKERVETIVTPGETVDVVVTERGLAVNPESKHSGELQSNLKNLKVPLLSIEELKNKAYGYTGKPHEIRFGEKTVAVIEYRDGSAIDVIRNVK